MDAHFRTAKFEHGPQRQRSGNSTGPHDRIELNDREVKYGKG